MSCNAKLSSESDLNVWSVWSAIDAERGIVVVATYEKMKFRGNAVCKLEAMVRDVVGVTEVWYVCTSGYFVCLC